MKALSSSEAYVLTRASRLNIREDDILQERRSSWEHKYGSYEGLRKEMWQQGFWKHLVPV
jgi:hypothetical protein